MTADRSSRVPPQPSASPPDADAGPAPNDTLPLGFEQALEAFAEAAPLQQPATLASYLGAGPPPVRRLVAWELIKIDLAEALAAGLDRWIEDYCDALPELLPLEEVPLDLVMEEQVAREAAGLFCDGQEYRLRFPHLRAALDRWMLSSAPAEVVAPQLDDNQQQIDEFRILRLLGRGAFASVYLARQETMQRLVALKLASRSGEEPQALARLDHPGIVRVYDQRTRPSEPRDLIYMEYVPGGTLSEVIASLHRHANAPAADATSPALPRSGAALLEHIDQRLLEQGQVPPQDSAGRRWLAAHDWASAVAWIGFQLAQALDYAHRQGVCHRDVKPANVLLTAEAVPKLADFNVSLATGPQGADAESNFGGSLAYMSPEQLRVADAEDPFAADQIDGRSDLYGLGLVLWELWQGQRPWPAAALTATRKAASQEAASQEAANREAANQQASGRNTQTPAEDLATRPPQQVRGGSAFAAAGSLMGLVRQQQQLRRRPLPRPLADSATGRALGRVLFSVLQHDPTARPVSGAELAAGLRLALTPEAAPIFHPRPGGLRDWLLRVPVWLLAGVIILIPNIAAGAFNYWYNATEILRPIDSPALEATFGRLAMGVNAVAYPLGVVALVWFSQSVRRGLTAASTRQPVAEASIRAAWRLGMAAAMIGGSLWVLAGLIYPAVLKALHPEFSWDAAFHFFVSLVLCGGVAWTVPFFGGTAAGVLLYYPVLIAPQMHDSKFRQRIAGLKKLGGRYLIAAAMVPLLAAALLAESDNHAALLMTLAATAGGILISFAAYQRFDESFQKLQAAIANREEVISHARLSRATFDPD